MNPEARNVRRHVEFSPELDNQLQTLAEQNNFQKYFEIIDGLDKDVQKAAYEIEFERDKRKAKVMHLAAFKNNVEAIKEFHRRGVSINSTANGVSVLYIALRSKKIEVLQWLISLGVDLKGDDRWSPMHEAAFFGNVAAIAILKQAGVDINGRSRRSNATTLNCRNLQRAC